MVHIETVDLTLRGVTLPSDRVGMVVAQPRLALTPAEPFQCRPDTHAQQLALITRTLGIARERHHGAEKTHFTIFPEFCIPGLAGIAHIEAALGGADWPPGTIVIGGIDGLTRPDYLTVLAAPHTFVHLPSNGADRVAADQWVNCVVLWIKGANNLVERWIQPKLYPSRPENNAQFQRMFRGGSIYLFRGLYATGGAAFRFSSLVCFDWIATVDAKKPWQWLLEAIHNEAAPLLATIPLTWLFVVQNNDQPNHPTFLGELSGFYDPNQCPSANRQGTCIVFANNAGADSPGRVASFGCSSLIVPQAAAFPPTDCYVTYSNGGTRFRGSNQVWPHRDVFFREGGPCIHSFLQVNPTSLVPGAAGQAVPVENPFVFPIVAGGTDPRTPAGVVPGAVKWLNDSLGEIECLSVPFRAKPLAGAVATAHHQNLQEFRVKPAAPATRILALSNPDFLKMSGGAKPKPVEKHADEWSATETNALTHVIHTLDILRVGFADTTSNTVGGHAELAICGNAMDVLAVRGRTHEECLKHVASHLPRPRRRLLIITRDEHNSLLGSREGSIFRNKQAPEKNKNRFTDPANERFHIGFQELLVRFMDAATTTDLEGGVYEQLSN